mgnify:CR=1 FL=1
MAFEKQFGVIFTNPKLPVLDYCTLDNSIEIGSLVEVPLGSKVVIGIVWSIGDTKFDHSRLKQIMGTVNNIKLESQLANVVYSKSLVFHPDSSTHQHLYEEEQI